MERLGETREFGSLLIRLAGLSGWRPYEQLALDGPSLCWLATDRDATDALPASSLDDVAVDLFKQAMERTPRKHRRKQVVSAPQRGQP